MFKPPLQRLAWKETRTVAVLWIMLLVATLILQTLVPAIYEFSQIRYTQQLFVLAYVLAACFGITAAAVLFAGEHEEGTLPFLRQLPVLPRDLLIAKFGVILIGTLLLLLITLAFAAITDRLHLLSQRYNSDKEMAFQFRDSLFGFLAWGIFFSLINTHVLRVLVSAVIAEGLSVFLIWNVIFDRNFSTAGNITYFSLVGVIAAIDLWLAWHWVQGRQVATIVERADRESAGTVSLNRWQRALIHFASAGSPLTRQLGVLVWLEARRAAGFVLRWWAVGLFVLIGITLPPTNDTGEFLIVFGFCPFLFFTPLACGLFVAQNDQRALSMTFLGDRGTPPAATWSIRQLCWLSLSLATMLLFLAAAYSGGALEDAVRLRAIRDSGMLLRLIGHLVSIHCILFVIGQLCGFWFRQTIVAWVIALILGLLVPSWHILMWHAEVPLLIGVWPVGVAWLAATFWPMNDWLGGRTRPKTVLRRTGWLLVPLLMTSFVVAVVRTQQVPNVDIGYTAAEAERELRRVDRNLSAELTQLTERANGLLQRTLREQPLSKEERARMVKDIRAISPRLRRGSAFSYPPIGVAAASEASQIRRRTGQVSLQDRSSIAVWIFLAKEFDRLMTERRLDEALELCFTMLELNQGLAVQQLAPDGWNYCIEQQEAVWNCLARWANDPDQTVERLEKARAWWVNRQQWFELDPGPMLRRWYGALSMSLRLDGPLVEDIAPASQITHWTVRSLLTLTGENRRLDRLFRIAVSGSQRIARGELPQIPFVQDRPTPFSSHSIRHPWYESTIPWPPFDSTFRELQTAHSMLHEERTAQQAALLTVLLQIHRHQTGKFPEFLTELQEQAADISLLQPVIAPQQTRQFPAFEYSPRGYPVPVVLDLGIILPAGQPVLFGAPTQPANEPLRWNIDPQSGKQWLSSSRWPLNGDSSQAGEYFRRRMSELDLETAEKNPDAVSFFSVEVYGRHSIAWQANWVGWNSP